MDEKMNCRCECQHKICTHEICKHNSCTHKLCPHKYKPGAYHGEINKCPKASCLYEKDKYGECTFNSSQENSGMCIFTLFPVNACGL